jgi:hypothetical protein
MTHLITRRRAGAGVAIGALVSSTLLLAPTAQAATAISDVRESQIAKDATTYAGWHQGAVNDGKPGQFRVVNEGLELTGRSQVLRGYTDNDDTVTTTKNLDLATQADDLAFTVRSGSASLQLPVFVDLDGSGPDKAVFTTLRTPLSTTGGAVELNDEWESSKAFGDVAANTPTPLSTIVDELGSTYKVIGVGVYSESGTTVVSDVTVGDTQFVFKNTAPAVKDVTVSTRIETPLTVPLSATDVDGNELTYAVGAPVGGTVSATGTTATFTPARGFKGNASFGYTVTDGRGGSSTGTVTVKVTKLAGKVTIYRIHPSRPSVRSTVKVYATVTVDGKQAARGTTVHGYAKGKKVVTGKVNSSGKVRLTLPDKLPAGKATLKVVQAGSSKINGGSSSVAVRVRK